MKHIVSHILLAVLVLGSAGAVRGQETPLRPDRKIQLGMGLIPGLGLQAVYVSPTTFYTSDGGAYVDVTPPYSGGEGSVQVSLAIGGSIRPLALVRALSNTPEGGTDLDVGLRLGPSLFFAFNETRVEKNQRFGLFLEPYVRFTSEVKANRTFFIEAGIQRPLVRAGLWLGL